MIAALGRGSPTWDASDRPVVVFDWDNTVTKNDTGDRFTFWMLNHDKEMLAPEYWEILAVPRKFFHYFILKGRWIYDDLTD